MTTSNYGVICPHCSHQHNQESGYDLYGYPKPMDCDECGKTFNAWVETEYVYYSEIPEE